MSYTVSGPIGSSVAGDSPTRSTAFGRKGKGLWPSRSVDKKETIVKVRYIYLHRDPSGCRGRFLQKILQE